MELREKTVRTVLRKAISIPGFFTTFETGV